MNTTTSRSSLNACPRRSCAREFFSMMVELKLKGFIAARTACVLSYWAKRGGLQEPGSDLALPPTRTGGHYSSHFDKVVGVGLHDDSFYMLDVPPQANWVFQRLVEPWPLQLAYDRLAEELSSTVDFQEQFRSAAKRNILPPTHENHPLVREAPKLSMVAIGLYFDAVAINSHDGALRF